MTLCATILRWTDSTVSSWRPTPEPATRASTTHWTTGGQRKAAVRLLSLHFSSVKQPKHKHEQNEHLQKCELILFSVIFKSKKCFLSCFWSSTFSSQFSWQLWGIYFNVFGVLVYFKD